MRRITQLVALIVALFLAGQAVLAGAPCSLSGVDHAPGCCIAATGTAGHHAAADCHGAMLSESAASACTQGGCQMATGRPAAQALTTVKSRAYKAAAFVVIAQLPVALAPVQPTPPFESSSAQRPARYLLFQVFRI